MSPSIASTSSSPLFLCSASIPNNHNHHRHCSHPHRNPNRTTTAFLHHFSNQSLHLSHTHFPTLAVAAAATTNCKKKNSNSNSNSSAPHSHTFLEDLYSFTNSITESSSSTHPGGHSEDDASTTIMRWSDFKAALGQRLNVEGIVSSVSVVTRDRSLAIPHISVKDIRYIDWGELRRRGFRAVVFDKDNTITAPYSLTMWPPLEASMERCKSAFGNDIVVFSNSAGLFEYDPDGLKARALEKAIGIRVLRHKMKKPAGTSEEIEKHFGCTSSQLIMVGDRPFLDIVYGNRNGFLTILTEPFSLAEEPFIVRQVRKLEVSLVKWWSSQGLKPSSHSLLPDPLQGVKDRSP